MTLEDKVNKLAFTVETLIKIMQASHAQSPAPVTVKTAKKAGKKAVKAAKATPKSTPKDIPVISGDGFVTPASLYAEVKKHGRVILRGRALCCYLKIKFAKGLSNPFHAEKIGSQWVVSIK